MNKPWEKLIAASRNEQIPELDVRRKIRERLAAEGVPTPEGFLEYFGRLCSLKPFKYAFLSLLLISVSGYAAVSSSTEDQNSNMDPVASFLIDSNYSTVSNES